MERLITSDANILSPEDAEDREQDSDSDMEELHAESGADDKKEAEEEAKKKTPVWMKQAKKKTAKKGGGGGKQKQKAKAKKGAEAAAAGETGASQDGEGNDASGSDDDSGSESDAGAASDEPTSDKNEAIDEEKEEAEWARFQKKMNKREKALEGKSRVSHSVHAPFFTDDKQEFWWVYIADRKNHALVTPPSHVTSLVDREEVELKFTAPQKPGHYSFTVCVKSDSYLGMDYTDDIKLDVQEAHAPITEHPQWEFEDDDEEESKDEDSDDEYATDDEFDEEEEEE